MRSLYTNKVVINSLVVAAEEEDARLRWTFLQSCDGRCVGLNDATRPEAVRGHFGPRRVGKIKYRDVIFVVVGYIFAAFHFSRDYRC